MSTSPAQTTPAKPTPAIKPLAHESTTVTIAISGVELWLTCDAIHRRLIALRDENRQREEPSRSREIRILTALVEKLEAQR